MLSHFGSVEQLGYQENFCNLSFSQKIVKHTKTCFFFYIIMHLHYLHAEIRYLQVQMSNYTTYFTNT